MVFVDTFLKRSIVFRILSEYMCLKAPKSSSKITALRFVLILSRFIEIS